MESIRNKNNKTPLTFAFDIITSNMYNDDIFSYITKPYLDDVKNKIKSTDLPPIKYIDNMFYQVLTMYNHMFMKYMFKFIKGWSKADNDKIKDILAKFGVVERKTFSFKFPPFLDLTYTTSTNDQTVSFELEEEKNNKLIKNINERLKTYEITENDIKTEISESDNNYFNKKYNDYLGNYQLNINKQKNLLKDILMTRETINKKVKEYLNKVMLDNNVNDKVTAYLGTDYYGKKIGKIYDDIFNDVFNKNYTHYNKYWEHYILNPKRNESVLIHSNIIKALHNFQYTDKQTALDELQTIQKLYDVVFINIIKDLTEYPQELDKNYVLREIVNIIENVVKTVICPAFYFAIVRSITLYIQSTLRDPTSKNITDTLLNIIGDDKLKNYIYDEMPMKLTKSILQIFDDDVDPDRNLSIDQIFLQVIDIIVGKNETIIKSDSSVINDINKNIEYFKILSNAFITNAKTMIDYLNNRIMNDQRAIVIFMSLLEKSITETK